VLSSEEWRKKKEEREMNRLLITFISKNFVDEQEKNSDVDEANSMVRLTKNWRKAMAFAPFTWGLDKTIILTLSIYLPTRDGFNAINRYRDMAICVTVVAKDKRDRSISPNALVLCWSARHAPRSESIGETSLLFLCRLVLVGVHWQWRCSISGVHPLVGNIIVVLIWSRNSL
jgi:hypothetical protein